MNRQPPPTAEELLETSTPFEPDSPPGDGIVVEEMEALVDAEGRIQSGKLAGRSMWSAIWVLAIPVLLQQTMTAMVGMVDTALAGRLPDDVKVASLDAIGIGAYMGWFIMIAMTGLGIGCQALIARGMGAGDRQLSHRALGQAITLSVMWGLLVGAVLWFASPYIGMMCDLSDEALVLLNQYVRTICVAMPLGGIMMVGSMCLHGAGETTKPSLIAVGVNFVNIGFSWLLCGIDFKIAGSVIENPFNMQVMGIAMGTAISFAFGAAMMLLVVCRGVKDLKLQTSDLPIDPTMLFRIVRLGIPAFFEAMMMWSVNLFVLIFIGQIAEAAALAGKSGEGYQGAHMIAVRWEAFSFLPGFAMGTAAGALAGQYLGAGNARLAKRAILACTGVAIVIMGLLGIVFMTRGVQLTSLIDDGDVYIDNVPKLLFVCGVIQVFFATTMVVRQGLRGVGDTKWTFIITTLSSYLIRLPGAWLLGVYFELGLLGIWIALCGELVIRAFLFCARFFHGGWMNVKV